jgi:ABC-type dipeptide/oligopeptide/nickel transport system ATPase component
MSTPILRVDGLTAHFHTRQGDKPGLDNVTFDVVRGGLTAIVGETGSGKSLTALSVLGIQPASLVTTAGTISFEGMDLLGRGEREMRNVRGKRIAMVFQDARAALNPVLSVGRQLEDVCRLHHDVDRTTARTRVIDALREVQIPEPERRAKQYPHEFSGGMAQRVMIAMALICEPELVILDEPTTGLDVTIQAEIMRLIVALTEERGLTAMLITHDLGVVAETCDAVVVMQSGQVVETASAQQLFTAPRHWYTQRLLAASRLIEAGAA